MLNKIKGTSIWFGLYVYWAVLLIWQNIRSVGNRGGTDVLIKAALIVVLFVFFIMCSKIVNTQNMVLILILTLATLLPIMINGSLEMSKLIYYLYPLFLCFCVYGIGNTNTITKKQLTTFCNIVIATVWYIVLYAIIFCTDQFVGAFSLSTAYGNELSSFLPSNYEYGLYLTFGIMLSVVCMEINKPSAGIKLFYIVTIIVFIANLILTFSRTCIIAFLLIVAIYIIFSKKSKAKYIFVVFITLAILTYFLSGTVRTFVDEIVFKGNANSGRSELIELGMDLYLDANLFEQIFGMEYGKFSALVEYETSHSSLHNAYIQTLLTNGVKGVIFVLAILITSIVTCVKTLMGHKEHGTLIVLLIGFVLSSMIFMLTTTGSLFASSIDSYFLTVCAIIVPKYVCNAIRQGKFDSTKLQETPNP